MKEWENSIKKLSLKSLQQLSVFCQIDIDNFDKRASSAEELDRDFLKFQSQIFDMDLETYISKKKENLRERKKFVDKRIEEINES